MSPARRGRPLHAVAASLALGCTTAPPAQEPPPLPPRPRWTELEAARTWPLAVPRRPSRGHAPPRFTLEVRITPATAVPLYRGITRGQTLPDGTRIAAFHTERGGEAAWVYVLEKGTGGAWSALAVEPDGTLSQGDLSACLSCHEEAPADRVFGPGNAADPPP